VRRRVSGRDHFLSLDPGPLTEAAEWMLRARDFWSARLDSLEAALRADDAIEKASRQPSKPKRRSK